MIEVVPPGPRLETVTDAAGAELLCVVSLELQFGVSGNAIWMKNEKAPACVGVPDSVPLDDIDRPGGEPPPRIDHTSSPGEQPCPAGSLNVIE